MVDNKIDTNALTEVYTILTELDLYKKIPNELQDYIKENKNNDYVFNFDKLVPLFPQVHNDTTRVLLSYLYTKYINGSNTRTKFILNDVIDILKKVNN